MKHAGVKGMAAALAFIVLGTLGSGCANKDKEQLAALQADYNNLANQNKDLRDQLAQSKGHESELTAQLDAKDQQLASKDKEMAGMSAKGAPAAKGTAAGNWDVGRYADRVTVGTDILFESGKATLAAKGKAALDKIVEDLKKSYAGMPVRVYGYTDSDAIQKSKNLWKDNLDLSANRAMAVTRYLIEKGIKAESVETVAMGATHFVTKNDTNADKAKNRRVEIVVVKQ